MSYDWNTGGYKPSHNFRTESDFMKVVKFPFRAIVWLLKVVAAVLAGGAVGSAAFAIAIAVKVLIASLFIFFGWNEGLANALPTAVSRIDWSTAFWLSAMLVPLMPKDGSKQ